jgi:hypothetical protein
MDDVIEAYCGCTALLFHLQIVVNLALNTTKGW